MLGVSAHNNIGVTVDGTCKVIAGRRLRHQAGVHTHRPQGQSSPLCASVGGGMAAGAAFAHPRAADTRVRPIF